ncbi:MAG: hypothetical protein HY257_01875, partial [Chloroflexi bacterium]|nr:hypothetical protein [Chloroflexota bacterium]
MRYYLRTLGCAKNTADSDGIGSLLQNAGLRATENPREADVMIVNTCGFLQAARAESLAAMRELGDQKRDGQLLIGAGCLISRYGAQVQSEVPQVDGVIDAGKWLALPRFIDYLKSNGNATQSNWLNDAYVGLPRDQVAARSVVAQLPRVAQGPSA